MEKKDILLLYPSYSYPRKSPPLGLAYLAAYMEAAGFSPRVYDFNVDPMGDEEFAGLLKAKPWLLVGLSFMTNQFAEARRLCGIVKSLLPDVPLVAGGPHPSSIPSRTLEELPSLDIVVKGEGERTLEELAEAVRRDADIADIPGVCFRRDGQIVENEGRTLIADLDSLPFPAWKHFDLRKYSVFTVGHTHDSPAFALLSSRGCPNSCTFCDSHTTFGRRFRARSAQNIFQEMTYLHREYGMLLFDFVDDLITVNKARVLELCGLIRGSGIPFQWMANARVNTVDREMLAAMKESGCTRVDFGVETGDPQVRKLMRKNITDAQIIEAHQVARDVGLSTGSFTMVGNLGETRVSARMTVELLEKVGDDVMVSIACPFPGTELYRTARAKGFINSEDWDRYVTSPTYTAGYYPVMRSEFLSEEEILESFYYIHSFFARRKFQRRFGKRFYLNPSFYGEWLFRVRGIQGRCLTVFRVVKARVRATLSARS